MRGKTSSLWKKASKNFQSLELFRAFFPDPGKLCAAVLLGLALTARGEDLTLEQAINTALRDNRELTGLILALQSSYLGVEGARNEFKLTFAPVTGGGLRDDGQDRQLGLKATRTAGWTGTRLESSADLTESERDTANDFYRSTVRVEVQQPILRRLGPLVNLEPVRQAQSRVMQARREVELRRSDIVVRVVESFEELLRLQKQVEFDGQSLERFDKLYRLTKAREEQGRVTRVDSLRTEFERGRAEVKLAVTREQLGSLRRDFADLLGQPPEKDFTAVGGARLDLTPPAPDAAAGLAMTNRLDYAQSLQDLDDAVRGVRVARRNLLPDLDVVGRYEWTGEGSNRDDATKLDQDHWFVGLTLDTDLHRRPQRLALTEAHISEKTAQLEIANIESTLRRQVQQALLSYERARKEMSVAQENYSLAIDRAKLARRLFDMGRGDNFTVTDAETALLNAESDMLSAQAQANVAAYRVLQMLGTLIESPDDLKPRRAEG